MAERDFAKEYGNRCRQIRMVKGISQQALADMMHTTPQNVSKWEKNGISNVNTVMQLSEVLGQIPPERLSGGAKALILMYEEEGFYTDLIVCGGNCESLILDIAQQKDISCSLSGYDISFEKLGDTEHPVPVRCENDGNPIKTQDEFVRKMLEYAGGMHA